MSKQPFFGCVVALFIANFFAGFIFADFNDPTIFAALTFAFLTRNLMTAKINDREN